MIRLFRVNGITRHHTEQAFVHLTLPCKRTRCHFKTGSSRGEPGMFLVFLTVLLLLDVTDSHCLRSKVYWFMPCMFLFGRQDRELAPAQAPATPATAMGLHQKWKLEARPQSRWESCVTGSDLRSFFLWKICGKMSFLFENNFLNTGMCRAAAGAWASANPKRVTMRLSWNWYEAKGWARWAPGDGIGLLVCMHLVKSPAGRRSFRHVETQLLTSRTQMLFAFPWENVKLR